MNTMARNPDLIGVFLCARYAAALAILLVRLIGLMIGSS